MWAVSYSYVSAARAVESHILISRPTITPRKSLSPVVVAASDSDTQSHQNDNDNDNIGGLGRTILTALQPRNQSDGREDEISGSDVLWALSKVAHKKKKKKKTTKNKKSNESPLSSVDGRRVELGGDNVVDVRPLVVKNEWGPKLDDLEKRLKELSQTK